MDKARLIRLAKDLENARLAMANALEDAIVDAEDDEELVSTLETALNEIDSAETHINDSFHELGIYEEVNS